MLFRLTDVYKSYSAQDVLRGASLQVNPGEHVGLVGRNGAGKTTLFRLITGEESPERGDDLDSVLERYSDLQHEFERLGGFEYAAKAEAILQGLGFDRDTWATPS